MSSSPRGLNSPVRLHKGSRLLISAHLLLANAYLPAAMQMSESLCQAQNGFDISGFLGHDLQGSKHSGLQPAVHCGLNLQTAV